MIENPERLASAERRWARDPAVAPTWEEARRLYEMMYRWALSCGALDGPVAVSEADLELARVLNALP